MTSLPERIKTNAWLILFTNALLAATIILWTVGYLPVSLYSNTPAICTKSYYTVLHCPGTEATEDCYLGWITYKYIVDGKEYKVTRGYPEEHESVAMTIIELGDFDTIDCWYRTDWPNSTVLFAKPDKTPMMIGGIVLTSVTTICIGLLVCIIYFG